MLGFYFILFYFILFYFILFYFLRASRSMSYLRAALRLIDMTNISTRIHQQFGREHDSTK